MRNPRDVMVSSYHFFQAFKDLKDYETMEVYMERFLSGEVLFGSWFDHVKGWMEMKDRANIFFITYEELQQMPFVCLLIKGKLCISCKALRLHISPLIPLLQDLQGSVQRICRFLGNELNSQQIESVVENASFQKMKDNKMSNFSLIPESIFDHTKAKFMRKGISEDWKNHLTVAQSEYFDRVYWENMCGVNMTFPWD
ncbi:sulfotransferase 2B1-like [Lacerta agilis]|uniref:sulfotransferase 2B1-like n=1 Tax=Lacerta agilis TaxID=80427 RepID=UPI001419FD3A|nr:sulfotransferase 2B1-like [Lacerta agilis]